MVLVVVVGVNDQLSCFDGQQTECRRVVCCVLCCNNNYQNRNLNAGSGGGPGTPSNSDENGREGERERAVNSAVEMIISSQDSPRPDWLDSTRVSL